MKKIIIIVLCIILLGTTLWKFNVFKETKNFILNNVSKIVYKINGNKKTKAYLNSIINEYKEKIDSYESLIVNYEILKKENEELRNTLNIPKENYNIIYADILEKSEIYEYMIINKGSNKNIKKGNPVITYSGFIGIISDVSNYSSKVDLIGHSKYPVVLSETNEYGQIEKYEKGYYYITGINGNVEQGNHIVTGKYSSGVPNGLLIGTVDSIEDNYGLSKTLKVKASATYNESNIVGVITKWFLYL